MSLKQNRLEVNEIYFDFYNDFTIHYFQYTVIRLPDFTYDGKIELEHHFRDDADGVTHSIEWSEWLFTMIQAMYDEDRLSGPYGISNTRNIM
jgi:hypothetical protein